MVSAVVKGVWDVFGLVVFDFAKLGEIVLVMLIVNIVEFIWVVMIVVYDVIICCGFDFL